MQQSTEFWQGTAKKSAFNLNFLLSVERLSYSMQMCSRNCNTKGWEKKKRRGKAISVPIKVERSVLLFQADLDNDEGEIVLHRTRESHFQAILSSLRGQCLEQGITDYSGGSQVLKYLLWPRIISHENIKEYGHVYPLLSSPAFHPLLINAFDKPLSKKGH